MKISTHNKPTLPMWNAVSYSWKNRSFILTAVRLCSLTNQWERRHERLKITALHHMMSQTRGPYSQYLFLWELQIYFTLNCLELHLKFAHDWTHILRAGNCWKATSECSLQHFVHVTHKHKREIFLQSDTSFHEIRNHSLEYTEFTNAVDLYISLSNI
jgi:hypothetical protein